MCLWQEFEDLTCPKNLKNLKNLKNKKNNKENQIKHKYIKTKIREGKSNKNKNDFPQMSQASLNPIHNVR